ncbi:type II secretion system F family protein [Streptomyces sp. C10-9-1]|uniref:type II secretion system F family protein n=1 Tax=Streptomyces sp. C10-9-1 TaxID=1859285 RepID=UPI003D7156E6
MTVDQPLCAAAVCAGAAASLLVAAERGRRRVSLLLPGAAAPVRRPPWSWQRAAEAVRRRREWLCLPLALVLAVLGASPLPLALGAAAVPLVRRALLRRERRARARQRAEAVVALCGAVAAELRAGFQPAQALRFAARQNEALAEAEAAVLAAARFGGDVSAALRTAARRPGAEGLAGMAACWQVAVGSGAGLAAGLERLEAALRADRDRQDDLDAQLAGAWSTVVLLALLPAAGLGMGWALGADPLRVLLHSPAGLVCLAVGGALEAAGLYWATRIVRSGEAA